MVTCGMFLCGGRQCSLQFTVDTMPATPTAGRPQPASALCMEKRHSPFLSAKCVQFALALGNVQIFTDVQSTHLNKALCT